MTEDVYEVLKGAFVDAIHEVRDRDPGLGAQAWSGMTAKAVRSVALRADGQAAVFVAKRADVGEARQWIGGLTDAATSVEVAGRIGVLPSTEDGPWGEKNAFPGKATPGKAFRRHDGQRITGGTLSWAIPGADPLLLGCLHCLAPDAGTTAARRDFDLLEVGAGSRFARVSSWKQLSADHGRWANRVDIATARLDDEWRGTVDGMTLPGLGPIVGTGQAMPGQTVWKNGATTGLTQSSISHVMVTSRVSYGWQDGPGEFVVTGAAGVKNENTQGGPFGRPGDSGSPVVTRADDGLRLLGFHFAGSSKVSLFFPADALEDELGHSLAG